MSVSHVILSPLVHQDQSVLLVQCPSDQRENLSISLRRHIPDLTTDIVHQVSKALQKVKVRDYQAIICWADGRDELTAIIRIRKAAPDVPLFLVSERNEDQKFRSLALQTGATSILPEMNDADDLAGIIAVALRAVALSRETYEKARRASVLSKEIGGLAKKTRELSSNPLRQVDLSSYARFTPLIALAHKEDVELTEQAISMARLTCRIPILTTGEEVLAYLDGRPPYEDRGRNPLPSVIILDRDLEKPSSFELLAWARGDGRVKLIYPVILSRSTDPGDSQKAKSLGATWYPMGATASELSETLKKISLNWTLYTLGLDPS